MLITNRKEKASSERCIVYLGAWGFPYGMAEVQKMLLVSKALVKEGAKVYVINSRGVHTRQQHPTLQKCGHHQGIIYIYSSCSPFREVRLIKRNLAKLIERLLELLAVRKLNRKEKIDVGIISSMSFWQVLFYKGMSLLFNFKVILNYAEYNSSMQNRKKIWQRINDFFYDRYSIKICDGVFPISEFLTERIKENIPGKKFIKIPVLVDTERFNHSYEAKGNYFLFCGAAGYWEVIQFIINSFERSENDGVYLYLVINGNEVQLKKIDQMIAMSKKSCMIKKYSKLTDEEVSILFKRAIGLLIPLRPTLQDKARFPHKIGEYLASGTPIITTSWGEIKYYFQNNINALITDSYDADEFADKMKYLVENPLVGSRIGANGRMLATEKFDYRLFGKKIIGFMDSLN